ncbi:helix-turn-helix domain-containing protein [Phytoactinopolyspora limicola]|uniref:helix-turn-helix domain-containing protein n=1 Tax=Phytoactinopolyspora limicola TaxID=2715536 RepID=UPI001408BF00
MRIASARDLGLYIRDRRLASGLTQSELAHLAGVSRRWLVAFEAGKSSAQLDLALQTLNALGLILDARAAPPPPAGIDLDHLLERHRYTDREE